jgi:transcriptional regulator with XRE-family HTH domain
MRASSQIVKLDAILDFHSLAKVRTSLPCQTVNMVDDAKNGGPNYLQVWREFRGMTQEKLAEEAGTTGSVISMLEAGERGLSAKWLRKLAPILDTTPGHLLDLDPREIDNDVIDIWATASSRQRAQIVQIAKTIVHTGTEG